MSAPLPGSYILCRSCASDNQQILYKFGFCKDAYASKLFSEPNKILLLDYYYGVAIVTTNGKLYYKWHNEISKSLKRMKGFNHITRISCGGAHLLILTKHQRVYEINDYREDKSECKIKLPKGEAAIDICAGNYYSVILGLKHNIYVCEDGKIEVTHKTKMRIKSISCMFYDKYEDELRIYAIDKVKGFREFCMEKKSLVSKIYLPDHKIVSIHCGNNHAVILTKTNDVYTLGQSYRGQIGTVECDPNNNTDYYCAEYIPQLVIGLKHLVIYDIIVKGDPNNNTDYYCAEYIPQLVIGLKHLVIYDIIVKGDHTLAITNDGVYGWGCNECYNLGSNLDGVVALPTKIDFFNDKIFDYHDKFKITKSARTVTDKETN